MLGSSHKINISNSWSKLESILVTKSDENYDENRDLKSSKTTRPPNPRLRLLTPNRIVLKDTRDGVSHHVKHYRPTTAPLRTSSGIINSRISIEGLSVVQIQKIYKAKCRDLDITVIPDQEVRFFNSCLSRFRNRRFEMIESGLGPESAKVIGEIIRNNLNFAYIDLGKNTIGDEGATLLMQLLRKNFSLVHIDISSNDITPLGSSEVFKSVRHHPSLASLNISSHEGLHRNRLGSDGAISLGQTLRVNPILQFLNLAATSIGFDGIESIVDGLANNKSLVSLNLANNNLDARCIEPLSQAIVTTNLRELNLASNKIGNEGSEYLSMMIVGAYDGACPLIKLDISSCEIGTKGISKIFAAVRMNVQLKYLTVNSNILNHGPSTAFVALLCDNVVLKELNISKCDLKPEHMNAITEGLAKNKVLETLNLSSNFIRDEGANFIAQGLAKNKSLKTLDLTNNKIKNLGAIALGNALKDNGTLENLILKDNSVKDDGGQLLSEVSRLNQNILKLVLDFNPVNLKFINDIRQNLKRNREIHIRKVVPRLKESIEKLAIDQQTIEAMQ